MPAEPEKVNLTCSHLDSKEEFSQFKPIYQLVFIRKQEVELLSKGAPKYCQWLRLRCP
jgi:hypothetical protein